MEKELSVFNLLAGFVRSFRFWMRLTIYQMICLFFTTRASGDTRRVTGQRVRRHYPIVLAWVFTWGRM